MNKFFQPGIILLLAIPRVVRILGSNVQIEDPNYIYGAFLILKGQIPFLDFAQPNPPLLEALLSFLYMTFGVSYRVPEIVSGLAFWAISICILVLGKRWHSTAAGVIGAILFSCHYLVFRYHLFERETFATLAVVVGLLILSRTENSWKSRVLTGVVIGMGFAFKQTALVPFAAICAVYLLLKRDFRTPLFLCAGFTAFVGGLTAVYYFQFGEVFLRQIFWFHFIKGVVAPWYIKANWTAAGLGYIIPPALAAIPLFLFRRKHSGWIPAAMICADLVFFWFVSGAFWPHYMISTLLPATILGGMAAAEICTLFRKQKNPQAVAVTAITILLILAITLWKPGIFHGKGAAEQFGFSGTPRNEIEACGEYIKQHTRETDLIIADPFVALVAERAKIIKFKDNWGLILWMNAMMEQGKYLESVKKLSNQPFGNVRKNSQRFWMPIVETAFHQGIISAVQPNYELPLTPEFLMRKGFVKGIESPRYTIWVRSPQ